MATAEPVSGAIMFYASRYIFIRWVFISWISLLGCVAGPGAEFTVLGKYVLYCFLMGKWFDLHVVDGHHQPDIRQFLWRVVAMVFSCKSGHH